MGALAVIAAATALSQLYQSEKARGANQQQLDQLKQQFSQVVPPNFGVTIESNLKDIRDLQDKLQMTPLTPQQYQVVAQYAPQTAPYVQAAQPELAQQTADMTTGRNAQLDALMRLKQIAGSNFDPQLAAQLSQASRQAQIDAQSRNASILSAMQRRGVANSGLAMALQGQAGAEAMNREAESGQNAAALAYQNRIQAIKDSAALGGNIYGQDQNQQNINAGVINQFNQRNQQNMQNWLNQRAQTANQAQLYNLQQNQDIANQNVNQKNAYDMMNRNYNNAMQQYLYGLRQQGQQYVNQLQQTGYNNQMANIAGQNNYGYNQIKMNTQNTQDRNNAIQGLGNAGMIAYMYGQNQPKTKDEIAAANGQHTYGGPDYMYNDTGYYNQDNYSNPYPGQNQNRGYPYEDYA